MSTILAPATPADEVVQIASDLRAFVDARMQEHPVFSGMFVYIFFRLCRLHDHLARLVARIKSGKKPSARAPRSETTVARSRRRVRNPIQWPRKFRALADKLGPESQPFADRLRVLLANPEAVAFIVANPDVGRYLRPLCRALGVNLIPELRLKRRPRPIERKSAASSSTPAAPPDSVPTPPPLHPPLPVQMTFTPTEDDPPMAVRVARYLERRRTWQTL